MSDIQVISGTRRAMKEMADGTLRVQIDIDPRFRAAFFAAFGQIDMPVAIAPLVADFEKREPEAEKAKGGPLAKLAGMLCDDSNFWDFLTHQCSLDEAIEGPLMAAEQVRLLCGIESRAELDSNVEAGATFHRTIRGPWLKWRAAKGLK